MVFSGSGVLFSLCIVSFVWIAFITAPIDLPLIISQTNPPDLQIVFPQAWEMVDL